MPGRHPGSQTLLEDRSVQAVRSPGGRARWIPIGVPTGIPTGIPIGVLIWILIGALGCAAPPIVAIDPGQTVALAPNEALLIVHVDSEFALKRLDLNRRPLAHSLGKGRHLWIVRLRQGSYRWTSVELASLPRARSRFQLDSDDELRFEVRAGMINYPGELSIRSDSLSRPGSGSMIVRNRNHSAMAIRELKGRYGAVLRSFPLHYAGLSDDGFLDYYTKMRDRPEADSRGVADSQGRAGVRSEAP